MSTYYANPILSCDNNDLGTTLGSVVAGTKSKIHAEHSYSWHNFILTFVYVCVCLLRKAIQTMPKDHLENNSRLIGR